MNRIEKSHLNSAAITHSGMTGKNNEDRFGVSAFTLSDEVDTPVLLAVLSDGIGGHRAGEVASEMVVDLISRHVAGSDGKSPTRILETAIQNASQKIYSRSQAEKGRKGMGATVACVWVMGQRLYTATVGDSRIYLIRNGNIHQLSTDHSWIQEAIDSKILTPEQAVGHPNAHVIRRYVGSPSPPEVDFRLKLNDNESGNQAYTNQGMMSQNGDRLLLCSDGLTDLVHDDEILSITEENPLEESNQILVDLANQRGGHDNITIIHLGIPEETFGEHKQAPKPLIPNRIFAFGCLGVILIAGLVLGLFFGINWLKNKNQDQNLPQSVETDQTRLPHETISVTETIIKPTHSALTFTAVSTQTVSPKEGETSVEGNIPPPLEKEDATAVPTDTKVPKSTTTVTATMTPRVSSSPTPTEN